jgi:hypothetical protein
VSHAYEIVPLAPEREAAWDEFAERSDDAWFWQTTRWIRWARAISEDRFVATRSFLIKAGTEVLAICPVNIELRGGQRVFSFLGGPIPAPAIRNDITGKGRSRVLSAYVSALADLACADGVVYGSVKNPFTRLLRAVPLTDINPWLRVGFSDLPVLTQVIDLRRSEERLWAEVSKGHRSDIKRAARACLVRIWDAQSITRDKFAQYKAVHAKDAGRVTRSAATFDMMEDWVRDGFAVLAEANHAGKPAAFGVIITHKNNAYYGSGCRDPDVDLPVSHTLQWTVLQWLRRHGCQLYDIGLQHFGPQWFGVPSAKEIAIASFTRGFGGETVPLVTAEWFYSADALERFFRQRLQNYSAACFGTSSEATTDG